MQALHLRLIVPQNLEIDGGWHACSACGGVIQGDGSGSCPAAGGKPHTLQSDEFSFPIRDFTYDLRFHRKERRCSFERLRDRPSVFEGRRYEGRSSLGERPRLG